MIAPLARSRASIAAQNGASADQLNAGSRLMTAGVPAIRRVYTICRAAGPAAAGVPLSSTERWPTPLIGAHTAGS